MKNGHCGQNSIFLLIVIAAISLLISCGGKQGLASPQIYGSGDKTPAIDIPDSITETSEPVMAEESRSVLSRHQEEARRTDEQNPDRVPDINDTNSAVGIDDSDQYRSVLSYGGTDLSDSASAIDDDIWRKFELAEEYYLMGVMANREASWEEAQYYFEKGMRILAKLDIEADTVLTPEAVKYSRLLDNFVADYRATLRSLGHLEPNVSASVVLERFSGMATNLGSDSIKVYKDEIKPQKITYDLPVVINDRVKKSIVYFQTVAHSAFERYLSRIDKYTPMMKRIINEYGLPEDLIYLALIESGYNPHAYSWARAMGLWQFISSTGRMYKLNRNWWMDERKDPIKSTHAACQYLRDLHNQFGDWELAMAAYNGGPGRVGRTMKKQKTNDFWKLRLRRQTMDYVPFIYAAAIIAKNPEKYGFTNIEKEPEVRWEDVTIDRCLELKVVARELGCKLEDLQQLNPELLRKYTPPDKKNYKLKVPVGSRQQFLATYDGMPSPKETSWVKHKIRSGETVSHIASRYGVSQYAILEANNLSRRSRIFAGKTLIVPVPLDRSYSSKKSKTKHDYVADNSIYTVVANDNLWDISRAFGTSVDALRRANYIERGSRIHVGQKLRIPSSARNLKKQDRSSSKTKKTYASSNSSGSQNSGVSSKHKVKKGDTIWDIARKYGTTTAKIRRLNNLSRSSRIYPGQMLVVSQGSSDKYVIHKVRRGESLSRIAQKYRVSMSRIISANDISDPDELRVGMSLRIYSK